MTGNFKQLGALVASMFDQELSPEEIGKLRAARAPKIVEAKGLFTPEMLQAIAADGMPENFEITREAYVALAQIAMSALNLVEEILNPSVAEGETPPRPQQH